MDHFQYAVATQKRYLIPSRVAPKRTDPVYPEISHYACRKILATRVNTHTHVKREEIEEEMETKIPGAFPRRRNISSFVGGSGCRHYKRAYIHVSQLPVTLMVKILIIFIISW